MLRGMKQKDLQTAEGLLEPFADRIERSRMYADGGRSLIVHFSDGRLRQFLFAQRG